MRFVTKFNRFVLKIKMKAKLESSIDVCGPRLIRSDNVLLSTKSS